MVATYANGAYAASARAVGRFGSVLWIDTNGSDPAASALDVEPGDATPAGAAKWVRQRLKAYPRSLAIIYTFRTDWQQVKNSVAGLPGLDAVPDPLLDRGSHRRSARGDWFQRHAVVLGQQL